MFKQKTVKIASFVAIVLSVLGLLMTIILLFFASAAVLSPGAFMSLISWVLLIWASIIGYKLCTNYTLYEDEYKKVGIRIYGIIFAFLLFFLAGLVFGFVLSVIVLSALWALKRNYDEWDSSEPANHTAATNEPPAVDEETPSV